MSFPMCSRSLSTWLLAAAGVFVSGAAASAQVQAQKLMASDGYAQQRFGSAVATDGDWIAVGVRDDDQIALQAGAAYMYQRIGGSFVEAQKLVASDASSSDQFGWCVAIDANTLVVGARGADSVFALTGAVYVFERIGTTWQETAKLLAATPHYNMGFGWDVAIHGDRIAVGARDENNRGAAYVFERAAGAWTQVARLTASDGQLWDFFGECVAISGDRVLVGSSTDAPGGVDQGAAYLYEFNGVSWIQAQKLYASDGLTQNFFSSDVALSGGRALIGASKHSHGLSVSGSAYSFERFGAAWSETQELRAHAPRVGANYGVQIAMSGDLAVVGAYAESHTVNHGGAGYVLRCNGSVWEEIGRLIHNDVQANDVLGTSVALSGTRCVVGVPDRDELCPTAPLCGSGAVYVFDLAPDARQFGWCMSSAPCANTFDVGGCLNSTGLGSRLNAAGSSSVALDELRFEVRDMQPGRSAILFMGAGVGQSVLGDGLRVVTAASSGYYRYSVRTAGPDGSFQLANVISHSQSFAPPGRIQPGSVWNFQCWHRDPAGPCNRGTNLTNAVEVTFAP